MIDIGVNLLNAQYDADRDAVIQRAQNVGITQLLITASDVPESLAASQYCLGKPGLLYCTAGVHPHAAASVDQNIAGNRSRWLEILAELSTVPQVVALGEMGLDYYRNFSTPAQQQAALSAQLELAVSTAMPVFAHEREAADDMCRLIAASGIDPQHMVIHCFTGNQQALQRYLELGCMIGITGWVCDRKRGAELRALVPQIPLPQLLIETDGPYLRPHNAPKSQFNNLDPRPSTRRNEPALLPYVIEVLATAMEHSEASIIAATSANAQRLFPKLKGHLQINAAQPLDLP